MTSYTRQEVFNDGDIILAEHGNNELNQVEAAFAQATGHKHDGTAAEGAYVPLISDTDNTDKVEIVTGGAKTTGTHQVTGATTLDASLSVGTTAQVTGTLNVDGATTLDGLTVATGNVAVSAGNITLSGTVDGRDVAADGTKLDGIEAGSTADQVASEVPFTQTGNLSSTDVQSALAELDTEKVDSSHVGSGGASHSAATVSVAGFMSTVDKAKLDSISVQTASGIDTASLLPFVPTDALLSTNVQAAIEELDAKSHNLATLYKYGALSW